MANWKPAETARFSVLVSRLMNAGIYNMSLAGFGYLVLADTVMLIFDVSLEPVWPIVMNTLEAGRNSTLFCLGKQTDERRHLQYVSCRFWLSCSGRYSHAYL